MAPLAVRKEPLLRFVATSWKVSNRCPSRAYNTTVQLRSPAGLGANEAASAAAAAAKTARDAEAASAAAAKTARDAEAITAAAMAAAMAAAEAAAEAAAAAAAAAVAGGTPAAAVNANTAAAQWSGHNIHIKRQPRQRHGKVCSPCSRLQFTIGLTPRPRGLRGCLPLMHQLQTIINSPLDRMSFKIYSVAVENHHCASRINLCTVSGASGVQIECISLAGTSLPTTALWT